MKKKDEAASGYGLRGLWLMLVFEDTGCLLCLIMAPGHGVMPVQISILERNRTEWMHSVIRTSRQIITWYLQWNRIDGSR